MQVSKLTTYLFFNFPVLNSNPVNDDEQLIKNVVEMKKFLITFEILLKPMAILTSQYVKLVKMCFYHPPSPPQKTPIKILQLRKYEIYGKEISHYFLKFLKSKANKSQNVKLNNCIDVFYQSTNQPNKNTSKPSKNLKQNKTKIVLA